MSDVEKVKVDPVNTRKVAGETVKEEYRYGNIHSDEVPDKFSQKNVDVTVGVGNVRWQYRNKCPILITPDGVYARDDAPQKEAQNQAFFALSILAEGGYVSHWEKL